jgi:hypothetical protein
MDSIAFTDGTLVSTSSSIRVSKDLGVTFTSTPFPTYEIPNSIAAGSNLFVFTTTYNIYTSSSKIIKWKKSASTFKNSQIVSVNFLNDKFIILPLKDTAPLIGDGQTFVLGKSPKTLRWNCVTYANGNYIAACEDDKKNYFIAKSPMGFNWVFTQIYHNLKSIAYSGGLFAAISIHSEILYSIDAINWLNADLSYIVQPINNLTKIIPYRKVRFIAIGDNVILDGSAIPSSPRSGPAKSIWYNANIAPELLPFHVTDLVDTGIYMFAVGDGKTLVTQDDNSPWMPLSVLSRYTTEPNSSNIFMWILLALVVLYLLKKKRSRR